MIDVKITSNGDFFEDNAGDLSLTGYSVPVSNEEMSVVIAQMAYMAIKTERDDFLLHPYLGNQLIRLAGLPNKPATASVGEKIITDAIKEWGVKNEMKIESWPEDHNTLGFEVSIKVGSPQRWVKLSMKQILSDAGIEYV